MTKKKILVLGAGLAGLSASWHLQRKGKDCLVFEKESEVGGLCRSKKIGGFTFDHCGHLLHFKHRYSSSLIKNLLGNNLIEHKKNAWVYSNGRFTRYPFQANLFGMPRPVIKECLEGFIQAKVRTKSKKKAPESFLDWINQTFGSGIAKHFMIPYNTKFWTVPPSQLTCEWFDGFIPVPSLKEIIEGTIQENKRSFGYNAKFCYPKKGGIQEIPRILSSDIKGIHTHHEAIYLDLKNKEVHFKNGEKSRYDILIFTLPLPEIINLSKDIPPEISNSLRNLKYNSIFNVNLGIDKEGISEKHWIYFPQKNFIFYRAGFPCNFSSESAPKKASSLYMEIAYSQERPINKNKAADKVLEHLINVDILKPSDRVLVKDANDIKYGYIIYDRNRNEAVTKIRKFLGKNNILCLGRYGSWSYMSMEDVLLEGKRIAEIL